MLGLVKESDRFLEAIDAVLRTTQEPVGAGHIGVELAEHERSRIAADDIYARFVIFDRFFAVAFLMQTIGDLAICLGHAEPVAVRAGII